MPPEYNEGDKVEYRPYDYSDNTFGIIHKIRRDGDGGPMYTIRCDYTGNFTDNPESNLVRKA